MEERRGPEITAGWLVDEVLLRYPTISAVFLWHGPAHRDRSDRLFPEYTPMTVEEYALAKQIDVKWLLRLLNAAVEAEQFSRKFPWLRGHYNPQ